MVFAISVGIAVAIAGVVLANADRRDDALTLTDIDDAHAPRRATGDADAVDGTADQRAAVGDQHDLVALQHRKRRHDLTAFAEAHPLHALAPASRDPGLVGGGALPDARRSDREHELLLLPQLRE